MKTIKKMLLLGTLLVLLTGSSCETNDIETGDHSFSCYINGKLFIPKANVNLLDTFPLQEKLVFNRDSYFYARATDSKNYRIIFNIEDFHLGVFNLKQGDGDIYENQLNYAVVVAYSNGDKTYLSKEGVGTVTFTEVSANNVEGTFEFTLYNKDDETDTIKVTKGKFND